MPAWSPAALIAAFTVTALAWLAVHRDDGPPFEVPYDDIDDAIDAVEMEITAASNRVEQIELEIRVIGLVEQIWAANIRMCMIGDDDSRAAAFGALYRLHQPLAGLRGRVERLDPGFRYEHLASCAE